VKELLQNETFGFAAQAYCFLVMKIKRSLPPTRVGRRPRRKYETSQKRDRDAIDAAFKRKLGDDGFQPGGVFGAKKRQSEGERVTRYRTLFLEHLQAEADRLEQSVGERYDTICAAFDQTYVSGQEPSPWLIAAAHVLYEELGVHHEQRARLMAELERILAASPLPNANLSDFRHADSESKTRLVRYVGCSDGYPESIS